MIRFLIPLLLPASLLPAFSKVVEYDLHIAGTTVSPTGKFVTGLT